jgi:hypothetical protein
MRRPRRMAQNLPPVHETVGSASFGVPQDGPIEAVQPFALSLSKGYPPAVVRQAHHERGGAPSSLDQAYPVAFPQP